MPAINLVGVSRSGQVVATARREESSIHPSFARPDLGSCATNPSISDYRQDANWSHRFYLT